MLIMIRRRALTVYVMLCVLMALAGGYWGWRTVSLTAGDGNKAGAEQLLFGGIIAAIALGAIGVYLVRRSLKMSRILKKVAAMNAMGGFSPRDAFLRLGEVGVTLNTIFARTVELSEKKSRKILAMSELVEHLLSTIKRPLLVANAAGTIVHVSRSVLESGGISRMLIEHRPLDEVLPGLDFPEAVRLLRGSGNSVSVPFNSGNVQMDGVTERDGQIAYVLIEIDVASLQLQPSPTGPAAKTDAPRSKGLGAALSGMWNAIGRRRG